MKTSGLSIAKVKEIFKIQKALARGTYLQIVELNNELVMIDAKLPENFISEPSEDLFSFVENLNVIQKVTNTLFSWPDEDQEITYQEVKNAEKIVEIVATGQSVEGNHLGVTVPKETAQRLRDEFSESSKRTIKFESEKRVIVLLDKEINLGPVALVLPACKLNDETLKRLENIDKVSDDQSVQVDFVVEHPGIISHHKNWLPDDK